MAAIAALDRAYYLNAQANLADRASYQRRKYDLERVRARFYRQMDILRETAATSPGIFQIRVNDPAIGRPIMSSPQCKLVHDLNNYIGVVIGHCELLGDRTSKDAEIAEHLSQIRVVAQKMAERIRTNVCERKKLECISDVG